jgi:hypothetical protein
VFEKGAERGDFLNYLVDAIDASSKRTDKMMTGYWLSIASYVYRSLRLEFGYNHAVASKSGKAGVIGDFAARLQIVIAAIFERLLTSLYTVRQIIIKYVELLLTNPGLPTGIGDRAEHRRSRAALSPEQCHVSAFYSLLFI